MSFNWTGLSDRLAVDALIRDLNIRMPRVARDLFYLGSVVAPLDKFGGDNSGLVNNDTPLRRALASLPSLGGTVLLGSGSYRFSSSILQTYADTGKSSITIRGLGRRVTRILTTATTTPGLTIGGTANDLYHQVCDLDVYQSGLTIPGAARAGNYGIAMTDSSSPGAVLRNVGVRYFGDTGLRLAGGHGPIAAENVEVQACSGWGVEVVPDGASVTSQDVRIQGGNLQFCWGGLRALSAHSLHVEDMDIELASFAQSPAIQLEGSTAGTFTDVTASVEALPSPAAVVYITSGRGNVFTGGLNVTTVAGIDNILLDSGNASWNTFVGGQYNNVAVGGGYYANISNASRNVFINPYLVNFTPGFDTVNDTNGANLFILDGVLRTRAGLAAGASLRLPHGAAPTAPVDGDMWTTSAGLYVRINGVTVGSLT